MDVPTSLKSQSRPRPKQTSSSASGNLSLSALPRFHPAAYSASSSKTASPSPSSSLASPLASHGSQLSPKAAYRFFDTSQRQQLSYYQQHLLNASLGQLNQSSSGQKPASPKLQPSAGSPGPVTPLELEDAPDGYFTAGRKSPLNADIILREEKKRLGEMSPRKSS